MRQLVDARNKQSLIVILERFSGNESLQVNNRRRPSLRIFETVFEMEVKPRVDSYLETATCQRLFAHRIVEITCTHNAFVVTTG